MTKRRVFVVYVIRNLLDGKSYIGKTSGRNCASATDARFKRHLLIAKMGGGWRLHAAIRKYGAQNFEVGYLHICQTERGAFALEVAEIARRAPGYNLTKGGDGVAGHKWTEQQRAAVRGRRRGPMPDEQRQRRRLGLLGKAKTPEHARNISRGKIGKPYKLTKVRAATAAIQLAKDVGAKFYSTDKPCRVGHLSPRYVSTRQCCECHRNRTTSGGAAHGSTEMHYV